MTTAMLGTGHFPNGLPLYEQDLGMLFDWRVIHPIVESYLQREVKNS